MTGEEFDALPVGTELIYKHKETGRTFDYYLSGDGVWTNRDGHEQVKSSLRDSAKDGRYAVTAIVPPLDQAEIEEAVASIQASATRRT